MLPTEVSVGGRGCSNAVQLSSAVSVLVKSEGGKAIRGENRAMVV